MDDGDALDPFAGIGTTLLAAQKTGRLGRDIELNPRYVDAAIERWQRMAGVAAVNAETGRTFEDMKRRPAN
jgi:DNA modification methylase